MYFSKRKSRVENLKERLIFDEGGEKDCGEKDCVEKCGRCI